MKRALAFLAIATLALGAARAQQRELRVCADPDNLPFSNERQEGFENKIAALVAGDLGAVVTYTWWPQRRGFIRNTLRARQCDLVMGVPKGFDPVLTTRAYYRSTYVIAYRQDRHLDIRSLDDTALRRLRIGVNLIGEDYENPPPAHALSVRGVTGLVGYSTFYGPEARPETIIQGLVNGDIDIAVVWGPLAGYFASRAATPLAVVALPDTVDRSGLWFAYDMAMGVRRSDRELAAELDGVIERRQADIARILQEYHVPVLTGSGQPASPPPER
ncbi:MAG: substrate-binding domain-containing protein [Gemmatimonadales bacterium]